MTAIVRNVVPALLFLLIGGVLHAEGVLFYQGSWEETLNRAAKENKYIMVDAYTDWCGWCKVMDKKTFTDPNVASVINESFIPVKINFEKGIGIDLGMKFRVSSYPTILFFNPQGQLVHVQNGYIEDNSKFIEVCKTALAVQEDRVYAFDSRDMDVPFPDFYRASFMLDDDRSWPEEEEVVAFLDKQDDLFSEVSWSVIWRFGGGDKYEAYLLKNMQEFENRYGQGDVRSRARRNVHMNVVAAANEKDESMLRDAIAVLDRYTMDDQQDMLKLMFQQLYFERTGEWNKFARVGKKMIDAQETFDANQINSICWTLYEKSDDPDILADAVEWMKPVIVAAPDNWMFIDTYAALLYKTGDMAQAEKYAKQAIQFGEELGDDVSATRELLNKITGGSDASGS